MPVLYRNITQYINNDLLQSLLAMGKDKNNLIQNKGQNYFTKNRELLTTVFADSELTQQVEDSLNFFTKEVVGEKNAKMRITQSWLNFNPTGTCHPPHNHTNSILSGVLYLNVDKNTGPFKLYRPGASQKFIHDEIYVYNDFNYENYEFVPEFGDMFVFTSNIVHGVDTNNSEIDRVSLAFNSFYTGNLKASRLAEVTV